MKNKQPKNHERVRPRDLLRGFPKYTRGQMMVIFALAATTLVGLMALGTDVGVLYYNWGQLQKAADASAEAGATWMPTHTNDQATATATTYATNNGVLASDTLTVTPLTSPIQMQVTIQRTVPYSFARVLGLTNGVVKASATARPPQGVSFGQCQSYKSDLVQWNELHVWRRD
jgi:Flp pilus assembly protein TadG